MIRVQTRISRTLDTLLEQHEAEFLRKRSEPGRHKRAA